MECLANHRHIDHHATEPLPYLIDELPAETTFWFQLDDEPLLDWLQQSKIYQPCAPSPVPPTSSLDVPVVPNAEAKDLVAPTQACCHNCGEPLPVPSSLYSWSDAPQFSQYDSSQEDHYSSLTISDPQIPLASYSTARTKSGRRSSRKSNKENAGPSSSHGPDRVKAHRRKRYSPYACEPPSRTPFEDITNETTTIRPRKTSNKFRQTLRCPVEACTGYSTKLDSLVSHFKGFATHLITKRSAKGLPLPEEHIEFIRPFVAKAKALSKDVNGHRITWNQLLKAYYQGLLE